MGDAHPEKLGVAAHVACGWPLALVAVGGAVGGALGGGAYAINLAIYRSRLAIPMKVIANVATGAAAIGIWLAIAVWLQG